MKPIAQAGRKADAAQRACEHPHHGAVDVSFVLAQEAQKLFIRHGRFSFSFAWFPPYGAAPVWGGSAASAVLHTASRRASVGAFPACSNGWGSLSRRACCPRAGICPAAVWRIPAGRHTPGKALHPFSHAHHDNTGAP